MEADEQQRQIARVKESKAQEADKQKRLERERKIASEKAARELASKEARDKRDEEFRTRAAGSTQMTSVVADKLKHLAGDGCRVEVRRLLHRTSIPRRGACVRRLLRRMRIRCGLCSSHHVFACNYSLVDTRPPVRNG